MKRDLTLPIWRENSGSVRVRTSRGTIPFSSETLVRSMLPAGICPARAAECAAAAAERLAAGEREGTVRSAHLLRIVGDILSETVSPEAAESYLMWQRFRDGDTPLVVLLAGDCTDIAVSLAWRLGVGSVVDLDVLPEHFFDREEISVDPETLRCVCAQSNGNERSFEQTDTERIVGTAIEIADGFTLMAERIVRHAVQNRRDLAVCGRFLFPWKIESGRLDQHAVLLSAAVDAHMSARTERDGLLQAIRSSLDSHVAIHSAGRLPSVRSNNADDALEILMRLAEKAVQKYMGSNGTVENAIRSLGDLLDDLHAFNSRP